MKCSEEWQLSGQSERSVEVTDSGWPMGGEHTHTLAVRWRSGIVISNAEQNIIGSGYSVTNIKEPHSRWSDVTGAGDAATNMLATCYFFPQQIFSDTHNKSSTFPHSPIFGVNVHF